MTSLLINAYVILMALNFIIVSFILAISLWRSIKQLFIYLIRAIRIGKSVNSHGTSLNGFTLITIGPISLATQLLLAVFFVHLKIGVLLLI